MKYILSLFLFLTLAPYQAAAQDEPTLKRTITWIQDKIEAYSRYVVVDSMGLLSEVHFSFSNANESSCRIHLVENAKGIGSASYSFAFSDIDPESIKVRQITEVYPGIKIHDDVYLITLYSKHQSRIFYCEYKGAYGGDTFDDSITLGVKTQDMAERLARAIKHAISLCAEEDDLFRG